jgi:hypothetical protein
MLSVVSDGRSRSVCTWGRGPLQTIARIRLECMIRKGLTSEYTRISAAIKDTVRRYVWNIYPEREREQGISWLLMMTKRSTRFNNVFIRKVNGIDMGKVIDAFWDISLRTRQKRIRFSRSHSRWQYCSLVTDETKDVICGPHMRNKYLRRPVWKVTKVLKSCFGLFCVSMFPEQLSVSRSLAN